MRKGGGRVPCEAEVVDRQEESPGIVTLYLRLTDPERRQAFSFRPGQFNMLYLFGVGESAISISSDPGEPEVLAHTIRAAGRVTNRLVELGPGDRLGLRGPFGRGWPMNRVHGQDIMVLTGGLGCAPALPVIEYVRTRRRQFGRMLILQGVKHSADLIWRERYDAWDREPDTEVHLAADVPGQHWSGHVGLVTELFDAVPLRPRNMAVMMCGPEPMMRAAGEDLLARGFDAQDLWLSLERNMHCAYGRCGHCQLGPHFVCRDGPVLDYAQLRPYMAVDHL